MQSLLEQAVLLEFNCVYSDRNSSSFCEVNIQLDRIRPRNSPFGLLICVLRFTWNFLLYAIALGDMLR